MGDGYLINSLWGVGRPSSAEVGLNGHPGRVSAGLNRLEFQDGKAGTIYLTPPTCRAPEYYRPQDHGVTESLGQGRRFARPVSTEKSEKFRQMPLNFR